MTQLLDGVAEHSQGFEVGVEKRPSFVGVEREVSISDFVWESFLKVKAKADAYIRCREQETHDQTGGLCSTCGMSL